ncbi:lytic murein transglycosylase [Parasphingopyxis algicola]|uniref:lytic murein transglycosylase n=1 Tax=Parasphingopyxis algicola TaxID=2026624 RepID=UPI0015A3D435|nr:lytic murein transglycosylase [Parasphingopyxis algicola]QLC24161.1 lytic murein transglycosylase [Parasphingopyxis algicola]
MRHLTKILTLIAAVLGFGAAGTAVAQTDAGFRAYMEQLRAEAIAEGVRPETLDRIIPTLSFNPRVIRLDRNQPGGSFDSPIPPFAPYRARHVNPTRIDGGRATYRRVRDQLREIEQRTGVPGKIAIAIYGHETNYGRITGNFDLPRSLATLAYEGRRRELFAGEFIAAMKMIDRGVPRDRLVGSWAGAFGYPQFLPSVYLRLAVDGDGDGRAEIWRSEADALASIENYLSNAGWRAGEPWGIAVNVPSSLDRNAVANRTTPTRCPRVHERHSRWMSMAEWRELGIRPQNGVWPDDGMMATLLEPDGPGNTAYLLTNNYRVILDYNCSNFYALSVGLLADAIVR